MPASDYDVIVVGARCAGSPLAMLLARTGYRVLLVDRDRFPSDTISSHLVFQTGLARMKRWGLLDRLAATGCPALESSIMDTGHAIIEAAPIAVDGVSIMYVPRRTVLDKLLVDAAVEAGAEFQERCAVVDVVRDDGRAAGVRVRRSGGPETEIRAPLVVGADGKNSIVARSVKAQKYRDEGTRTCSFYSYWSGVERVKNLILAREDWGVASGPTHDGLVLANVSATPSHLASFRADIEGTFFRLLDSGAPELAEALRSGRREERFRGLAEIPNYFRQSCGPGWALAGDAGYYRDPITAQGISDAFRDADLLAEAIDDGLGGRSNIDDSVANYTKRRDAESQEPFEWTLTSTRFIKPDPRVGELMRAIASDPGLSQQFVNLNQGLASFGDVVSGAVATLTSHTGT